MMMHCCYIWCSQSRHFCAFEVHSIIKHVVRFAHRKQRLYETINMFIVTKNNYNNKAKRLKDAF